MRGLGRSLPVYPIRIPRSVSQEIFRENLTAGEDYV